MVAQHLKQKSRNLDQAMTSRCSGTLDSPDLSVSPTPRQKKTDYELFLEAELQGHEAALLEKTMDQERLLTVEHSLKEVTQTLKFLCQNNELKSEADPFHTSSTPPKQPKFDVQTVSAKTEAETDQFAKDANSAAEDTLNRTRPV